MEAEDLVTKCVTRLVAYGIVPDDRAYEATQVIAESLAPLVAAVLRVASVGVEDIYTDAWESLESVEEIQLAIEALGRSLPRGPLRKAGNRLLLSGNEETRAYHNALIEAAQEPGPEQAEHLNTLALLAPDDAARVVQGMTRAETPPSLQPHDLEWLLSSSFKALREAAILLLGRLNEEATTDSPQPGLRKMRG